jgi:hypothetical protein
MKIFVSILQVLLALWVITGSVYMMNNYGEIASAWAFETLPALFWTGLGVVQLVLAAGLLVSVREGALRKYAVPSAIGLALITLLGLVIYSAYTGPLGMLWAIIPAALFGLVAYKRCK